jgi:dephospho-CoA kinase
MNTSNNLPEIVGVAGSGSAGQDTLAHFLVKEYGYAQASTSDMLRKISIAQYGNIERATLQIVGPAVRAERGAGALVIEGLEEPRPTIITSIRTLGEAKELKKAGGTLIFIDAEPKLRYERMIKRGRDGEANETFEKFMEITQKEQYAGPSDADYNLRDIKKIADISIDNNGTIEEFLSYAIEQLQRPS